MTPVTVTNPVDLSVGTPTVDKSTVAPGETFTLTTTVSNVGTGNFTGNTTLRYFRSADTTLVKEMGGAVRGLAIDSTKGNLYMTNARPNARGNIQRSKLDGSVFHWNYIDNLSPSLSSPRDIALDVAGGKVYWTEDITDADTGKEIIRIRRANLNGKNVEVVREISGVPRGLAVDSAKGNLYLANTRGVRGNIQRLKVDGSLFHWNYIHIAKANSPQGVALDVAGGKVYWTEAVVSVVRI